MEDTLLKDNLLPFYPTTKTPEQVYINMLLEINPEHYPPHFHGYINLVWAILVEYIVENYSEYLNEAVIHILDEHYMKASTTESPIAKNNEFIFIISLSTELYTQSKDLYLLQLINLMNNLMVLGVQPISINTDSTLNKICTN